MKKHYKMYLLGLALLLCGVVNGCQYDNFMKTVPKEVRVPEKMVKSVLKPLLTIPNPGKPEEQGTCAILSSEEAQQYYIDGVGFRNVEREEVKEGFSGDELNPWPMARVENNLDCCIEDCIKYCEDPKNASKICEVMLWALFSFAQVEPLRRYLAQRVGKVSHKQIFKHYIVLSTNNLNELGFIEYAVAQKLHRSGNLVHQAIPLPVQDLLVRTQQNDDVKWEVMRIYPGGHAAAFSSLYWMHPSIPRALPNTVRFGFKEVDPEVLGGFGYRIAYPGEVITGISGMRGTWPVGRICGTHTDFVAICNKFIGSKTTENMIEQYGYYVLFSDPQIEKLTSEIRLNLRSFPDTDRSSCISRESLPIAVLKGLIRDIYLPGESSLTIDLKRHDNHKAFTEFTKCKEDLTHSPVPMVIQYIAILERDEDGNLKLRVFEINEGGHAEFCNAFPNGSWVMCPRSIADMIG